VSVRIYDSLRAAVVDLEPRVAGHIGMYICGPTVQSAPHIGHLRSALAYDLWRRWLTHRGFAVTFIRNVTDIDDKVLANASDAESWFALAYRVELEFTAAYRALGILPPTYEPRATAHITQMLLLIERLIAVGHAYPAADGSADVYFDVRSWPRYGELTRQNPDDMAGSSGESARAKRNPLDFALWKGAKSNEPETAQWSSPWGRGRPGWHIECSAMAAHYLGREFDIHGGGLDLRFPHHENELAQSTAAGDAFARYWVHNGLITVGGQKMSKSLGNSVFAAELLGSRSPAVLRYWLGSAHYRSSLDYTPNSLDEADEALGRIHSFRARAHKRLGTAAAQFSWVASIDERVPAAFTAALDDDLATPQALAVLHETVRAGNTALDAGDDAETETALTQVETMVDVLGFDDAAEHPRAAFASRTALSTLVERMLADRRTARDTRDFATADRIRDELAAAGIALEDTPIATDWSIDGHP
jgi:cysteinyl-tRNA synthetase